MSDKPAPQVTKNYETADLGLAAFLLIKGCKLVSAGRKGNKYNFVFDCPSAGVLAIEYINSEFSKFDSALKTLKNLIN